MTKKNVEFHRPPEARVRWRVILTRNMLEMSCLDDKNTCHLYLYENV